MSIANDAARQAEALVLFGATGDLAPQEVFPALYSIVKHDALTIPVIGIAYSNSDLRQLRERVRDCVTRPDAQRRVNRSDLRC
jgi:glucose-6-phosphate 1-dehydrogenase